MYWFRPFSYRAVELWGWSFPHAALQGGQRGSHWARPQLNRLLPPGSTIAEAPAQGQVHSWEQPSESGDEGPPSWTKRPSFGLRGSPAHPTPPVAYTHGTLDGLGWRRRQCRAGGCSLQLPQGPQAQLVKGHIPRPQGVTGVVAAEDDTAMAVVVVFFFLVSAR